MKKNIIFLLSLFFLFNSSNLKANAIVAQNWLDSEISQIIDLYRDENIESQTKLNTIQDSINNSFAGNGIGRSVAGNAWGTANEIVQKGPYPSCLDITAWKQNEGISVPSILPVSPPTEPDNNTVFKVFKASTKASF